uniref:NADH:ubiquinone reductase (H(+)-translocating) n=1 Tax=Glossina palpalis gambiensis TaxID=67801 RepID=A0A1B0BFE4_9MUSC
MEEASSLQQNKKKIAIRFSTILLTRTACCYTCSACIFLKDLDFTVLSTTHALFKALLFICAGATIHNINNNQDIRLTVIAPANTGNDKSNNSAIIIVLLIIRIEVFDQKKFQ